MKDQYSQLIRRQSTQSSRTLTGLMPPRKSVLSLVEVQKLEQTLIQRGAFVFPLSKLAKGSKSFGNLKLLRAAATPMWPMGTNYWVRDNALIAERLIGVTLHDRTCSRKFRQLGQELLMSGLSLISTASQLNRFKSVIQSNSESYRNSASSWPQIFLGIKDNLSGETPEEWPHKQDAWQILAHTVLKSLASGQLSLELLTIEHREFLSLLAPFLARVRYYEQENSGSWEELEAVRSSVIAWDMALLQQILQLSTDRRFSFLEDGFREFSGALAGESETSSFTSFLNDLLTRGAHALKRAIPFECPQYPTSDARHRLADAALIYLLQLDTPRLVAGILDLPQSWIAESEVKLLKAIASLYDPRSGGHRRYQNDSFQRFGFFRPETLQKLNEMFGAPAGDASGQFSERSNMVPKGPEASWTHFTWQLSSWAGKRYLETLNERYFKLQQYYFQQGLRTIPIKPHYSVEQGKDGNIRLIKLAPYRCPECYLTEVDQKGKPFLFASPHTPLNWATAEAIAAFSAMYRSLC